MPTKIAYVDETWNPVSGCTKYGVGCQNCYAETIASRFWGKRKFSDIHCHSERLVQPLRWRKPRRILICSMGDLFHELVPFEFINKAWNTIGRCSRHTFLVLTKRPKIAIKFYRQNPEYDTNELILPNVHLGVTICTQKEADEKIPTLSQIPAAHRWISAEPLLSEIKLPYHRVDYCGVCGEEQSPKDECYYCQSDDMRVKRICDFDQVVVGCESGPKRRPCKLEWIRLIVQQCKASGIKCFVKQIEINGKVEHDISKFPVDLRIRETI